MDSKQTPPKPGMEQFKGNPVDVKKVKIPVDQGVGQRKPVTKND